MFFFTFKIHEKTYLNSGWFLVLEFFEIMYRFIITVEMFYRYFESKCIEFFFLKKSKLQFIFYLYIKNSLLTTERELPN